MWKLIERVWAGYWDLVSTMFGDIIVTLTVVAFIVSAYSFVKKRLPVRR